MATGANVDVYMCADVDAGVDVGVDAELALPLQCAFGVERAMTLACMFALALCPLTLTVDATVGVNFDVSHL